MAPAGRRTNGSSCGSTTLPACRLATGYRELVSQRAAREPQPVTRTVIRSGGREITDPAEVREWRVSLIRRGFEQRGEPWTEAAEQEARRRLGEVTRNGEIRGFAQSPIVR